MQNLVINRQHACWTYSYNPPTKLNFRFARRTSNVRSPLEFRSDRRETSGKRVSDDLQLSIFWRRIFFLRKICRDFFSFFFFFVFSWFSADFGGEIDFLTSKSTSTSNFASDTPILRSVRPKIAKTCLVPGLCQPYRHIWRLVWAWSERFVY